MSGTLTDSAVLKSAFISAFVAWLMFSATYALVQMFRGMDPLLSWFGMALAALGPLAFFAGLYLSHPARTARHPLEYSIVSGLGLAISMTISWRYGETAGMIHAWAGASLIGWLIYLRWYSHLGQGAAGVLAAGKELPDFTLRNLQGETISSNLFRGRAHVFMFIRGNWCPVCMGQVEEMAGTWQDIEASGARVVVISPQPPSHQQRLAGRFKVPMEFLQDPGNQAAARLGLAARRGTPLGLQLLGYDWDTVMPAVIITDASGRIVHSDLTDNYRIRPEPSDLLRVLNELTGARAG
jgi:peroxiredoxin